MFSDSAFYVLSALSCSSRKSCCMKEMVTNCATTSKTFTFGERCNVNAGDGGKGRLTDSLIDKLAHYYGNPIRCNSASVKEMRKAIWAVWVHSCSTDDEPMHWFCRTRPNTWCKYNAAINNKLQNYKHKHSVAKAFQDVIKPVFADLSLPALQKKCLGGKTHNPNESLNSLIWKFCPKTIGSSLQIADIAANLATSIFNDGNQILIFISEKFGLKINKNVCVSLAERDNRRIFTSRKLSLASAFEAHRAKKKKIKKTKEKLSLLSVYYDFGAF
ncbi:uncharacterized protein TNCV_2612071 [Trichonephila clavipes]|nr:uncharacterized protein TNCV_2612071 [Trichonephila clavipes]